jgi:hypothetical protein
MLEIVYLKTLWLFFPKVLDLEGIKITNAYFWQFTPKKSGQRSIKAHLNLQNGSLIVVLDALRLFCPTVLALEGLKSERCIFDILHQKKQLKDIKAHLNL